MLRFGVTFPQTEIGSDPLIIRDYAQAVEGMGYTFLLAYDHVLGANPQRSGGWSGPYTYREMFHEPFVLFGYLAGLTRTLELVSGVIILPQRQTALVAKQAAEVDVLSGGRLRLGIGIGWNEVEYTALGENFHNRGRRVEEQVTLLRRLFAEELVTFHGKWHQVPDAGINPLPVRRRIPIWFGGGQREGAAQDAVVARVARQADGWIIFGTPQSMQPRITLLRTEMDRIGRQRAAVPVMGAIALRGDDPAAWMAIAGEWEQLGVAEVTLNTMGAGFTSAEQHLAALRRMRAALG